MKTETVTTYRDDIASPAHRSYMFVRWNGYVGTVEEDRYAPEERERGPLVVSPKDMLFLAKAFLAILMEEEA